MKRGTVAVVILNYRRKDHTLECLSSLSASTQVPLRLIVVDNDSGDGSAAVIRSARPDIEVLETKTNLGYAGGMNTGLRQALASDAEYILALNSDTLAAVDSVSVLVDALDSHQAAGAATGTFFYYPEALKVWYAGGSLAYTRAHALTTRALTPSSADGSSPVQKVSFVTGCAILFRASALRRVGLFDERYFMYLEDVDLSRRFLSEGFDLLYVPLATWYHRLIADEQTPLKTYFVTRNRLLFLERAPGLFSRIAGSVYVLLVVTMKVLWWSVTDRQLARAMLLGVQDYFSGRFHVGRGLTLSVQDTDTRRWNADRH